MDHITIKESVTLPSKGKFCRDLKTCDIQLRSMTTEEEMLRVSATNTPYKQLCEIIDRCIINDIGMSSYDMHIGDYLYLLYNYNLHLLFYYLWNVSKSINVHFETAMHYYFYYWTWL